MERQNSDFVVAAEYQALNICIHTPSREFEQSYFPHQEARDIFHAIQVLRDQEEDVSEISLFREANLLNDSIDMAMIHTIFGYESDGKSAAPILSILKEASAKYKVNQLVEKVADITSSPTPLNTTEISSLLYEAQSELVNGQKNVQAKTIEQCLDDYVI